MTRPLNARQERFVHEFLIDQNAAAAAIRAGYSPNTKGTHAAKLMRNPLILDKIGAEMATMFVSLGVTAQELLKEQARLAYFDPACLFDGEGKPIPLHQLPAEIRRLLTVSYDTKADGTVILRVRTPNKQQALSVLEKRCAQFMELQMALLQTQIEMAEGRVEEEQAEEEEDEEEWGPPKLDVPNFRAGRPAPQVVPDSAAPAPNRGFINAATQFLRGNREAEPGQASWSGVQRPQGNAQAGAASRLG